MRVWTLAEANAALPDVRRLLVDGRKALSNMREAETQIEDLRIVWGEELDKPTCPEWAEHREQQQRRAAALDAVANVIEKFEEMGCEAKDLDSGLVDFRGQLGNEVVYLCWRDGEKEIRNWHSLSGGFSGRKTIPGL
ncbi:MAG: DUF2203 domain-containing protein [bacterium]